MKLIDWRVGSPKTQKSQDYQDDDHKSDDVDDAVHLDHSNDTSVKNTGQARRVPMLGRLAAERAVKPNGFARA